MAQDTKWEAKNNLVKAIQNLKWKQLELANAKIELNYGGNPSIRNLLNSKEYQLDNLISKINEEYQICDKYLQNNCPNFYSETSNWRINELLNNPKSPEMKDSKNKIEQCIKKIDEYVKSFGVELSTSFFADLKQYYTNLCIYGLARPWGTEFRQRLATAINLKKEVNSLWELGLNSIANSQQVYLGNHFIELISKDPDMKNIRRKIHEQIIRAVKSRVYYIPYLTVQKLNGTISGSLKFEFGGKRHNDSMLKQLKFTLSNPIASLSRYAATWNVGINELTWCLRHGTISYNSVYHVVYNVIGFAYICKTYFSINDTLDLRPHSKNKLDFSTDYNIITSILGSVYHDLLGNTDKLKVKADWSECNRENCTILPW